MFDDEILGRPALYPRNMWSRLRVVLHLIERKSYYQARRVLSGVRYNPDMTEELFAVFESHLQTAEASDGAVRRINIPTDFLGSENPRLLKPLRRLAPNQDVPRPFPWAMSMPLLLGTGNDAGFIIDAAAQLAGSFTAARKRIQVHYSPLNAKPDEIERTLRTLASLNHDGRIDVTLHGAVAAPSGLSLPGSGTATVSTADLTSPEGLEIVRSSLAETDLVMFLSGACSFDPMALARALHLAEVSDTVLQPLIATKAGKDFATRFTRGPGQSVFSRQFPFRLVQGLNMIVSPALLHEIGLPHEGFAGTYFAARDLAYRAYVRGAYFVPLMVPDLRKFEDHRTSPNDQDLYLNRCPNPWDRKDDKAFDVPKVSVYIPAYNASKYIERAVDSVLEQDVADLDVCIANDGSRDHTMDLLRQRYGSEPRVKILDNPNGGIGFASNSAIRMSNSLYIGQLDSDDALKPGAVRRLMSYLDDHPHVVCAYGSCERIDAAGNYVKDEYSWPVFTREKMMITSIAHHFRMFRRQAWERTTQFREDIVNGVDYDIFLKMSETGEFHHVDETLYQRRWHGENTSHVNEHHQTTNTYRVQRETLKRLGLARNWDIHVANPAQPRLVTYQLKPDTPMVVFWPDYSRANPYQKLLYQGLHDRAEVVSGSIEAALKLIDTKVAPAGKITFHLHWLNALFINVGTEAEAIKTDFLEKVRKFIWKGGRFVWTIHNTISHDTPFPDVERDLSTQLASIAHALHFHSAASIDEVAEAFPIPRDKVMIARHGNYIGVYPDYITPEAARAELGFAPEDDVLVFTGQIRGYKGIDTLIAAFRRILADRPSLRLVLAGKPEGDPLDGHTPPLTEAERARILSVGRFVEDGELQVFLRAADIAVYPYEKILTSGSLLLALSYGVPSVIPRVGMTAELLDGRDSGMLYDGSGGVGALEIAIRSLLFAKDDGRLSVMAANARQVAEGQTWTALSSLID